MTQPLTVGELAALLRVCTDWVYRECRAHRLPHTRIARRIRFTEAHVQEILAAGEVRPASAPVTHIDRARDARRKIA